MRISLPFHTHWSLAFTLFISRSPCFSLTRDAACHARARLYARRVAASAARIRYDARARVMPRVAALMPRDAVMRAMLRAQKECALRVIIDINNNNISFSHWLSH